MEHDVDTRKVYYISGVLDYLAQEYETEKLPGFVTKEMFDYLNNCYQNLTCYPNAAGKFYELFGNQECQN